MASRGKTFTTLLLKLKQLPKHYLTSLHKHDLVKYRSLCKQYKVQKNAMAMAIPVAPPLYEFVLKDLYSCRWRLKNTLGHIGLYLGLYPK